MAPAGQVEHTNPTRKRVVFDPLRIIEDPSLANKLHLRRKS